MTSELETVDVNLADLEEASPDAFVEAAMSRIRTGLEQSLAPLIGEVTEDVRGRVQEIVEATLHTIAGHAPDPVSDVYTFVPSGTILRRSRQGWHLSVTGNDLGQDRTHYKRRYSSLRRAKVAGKRMCRDGNRMEVGYSIVVTHPIRHVTLDAVITR